MFNHWIAATAVTLSPSSSLSELSSESSPPPSSSSSSSSPPPTSSPSPTSSRIHWRHCREPRSCSCTSGSRASAFFRFSMDNSFALFFRLRLPSSGGVYVPSDSRHQSESRSDESRSDEYGGRRADWVWQTNHGRMMMIRANHGRPITVDESSMIGANHGWCESPLNPDQGSPPHALILVALSSEPAFRKKSLHLLSLIRISC